MDAKIITPTPKQREAHVILKNNTIVVYGGSIRGGKSYWLLLELLTFCFQYPGSRWLILRASYSNIERTILMSFKNLLDGGLGQYLKKWDGQALTATFKNGSQIIFMAESFDVDKELNKFRGLEISGAGIDEVNEIQEATFNKIIERAGSWSKGGAPPKILATCNPTLGWVKKRIYDTFKENKLPKGWAYIPAKLTDNPHLSPEYIISLRDNMPPYEYEVYVNGNWDVLLKTGSEFYHAFNFLQHTSENVVYNPNLPLWLSFDENVNPYLTCIVGQIVGKQLFIIDEVIAEHPKNSVSGICQMIRDKYNSHINGMFITGDATSQKADVKLEKGFNFFKLIEKELAPFRPVKRVPSANPSVYMRGQFINAIFSINYSGINVVVNKQCKKLAEDLMQLRQAEDGTKHKETFKNEFGVTCERLGHTSDCFIGSTLIETLGGPIRIDKIKVGDYVLTRNGYQRVVKTYYRGRKKVKKYKIGNSKIICTPDHKIYTTETGFKEVGHLIGSNTYCIFDEKTQSICYEKKLILTGFRLLDILKVKIDLSGYIFRVGLKLMLDAIANKKRVYDIQVENEHEFFANGILAHNCLDYMIIELFKTDYSDYQNPGFRAKPIIGQKSYNKATGY